MRRYIRGELTESGEVDMRQQQQQLSIKEEEEEEEEKATLQVAA